MYLYTKKYILRTISVVQSTKLDPVTDSVMVKFNFKLNIHFWISLR